jgi:D-glycero-D-manno-heptose 1,7-bisphosphate phosphatase
MKLIILDRDGTINEDRDDFVKSPDEWVPIPGSLEAIARLNHAGWHTVVATNQSGLARRLFDMSALNAIHAKMHRAVAEVGGRIDAVFFCPHGPDDGCSCRKPAPGMVKAACAELDVDPARCVVVGDIGADVEAAAAAGAVGIMIPTPATRESEVAAAEHTVETLAAAVDDVLAGRW